MRVMIVDGDKGLARELAVALNSQFQDESLALNFELPDGEQAPAWIQLLPSGQVIIGRDGRTWINDRPEDVIAAFAADGRDLPIDYEHSTHHKAPKGEPAPAAAWVDQVELRDGAIWGHAKWTPAGSTSVMNREYRYISPVFTFDASGRIGRLVSCGLTNRPNLHLEALNHIQQEESRMLKKLLVALGLPETTTETEALNHVTTLKADHAIALNQAQNPPLDKFVPRADYQLALNRAEAAENNLAGVKKAELDMAINTEIDAALKAGKITPATKDYYIAQCRQEGGLDKFKEFVKIAPAVAGDTGLDNKQPGASDTALNAEQLAVAAMFGNTPEDIKKYGSA